MSLWRNLVQALLCIVFLFAVIGCRNTTKERHTFSKVLLISLDTLRPDFLGCYSKNVKTSPNIDRFAQENILCTQVTSQAPSTAISHKSILYSLYPSVHRTSREHVPVELLKSPLETIQSNGFKTAAFVGGGELDRKFGFARGFDSYWEAGRYSYSDSKESLELLENKVTQWIQQNHSEKFFLFVHTYEIHCPYYPPKEFRDKNAGWYHGDIDPAGKCGDNYYNLRSLSADDLQFVRDLYSAEIEYVDSFIGRLVEQLKDLGIYDDTVMILMSDHGESLGERGYTGHNYLYNHQLSIPLVMRIPGIQSVQLHSPVEAVDVMPTLFELLDIARPYAFQGKSLLPPIYNGTVFPSSRILISEQSGRVRVRKGDMIAIFTANGAPADEVYDLREDPEETRNLAKHRQDFLKNCKLEYSNMTKQSQNLASGFLVDYSKETHLDDSVKEQLRALGYFR